MTKSDRKDLEGKLLGVFECDECRIEIGAATWARAHVIMADQDQIHFRDAEGRYWQSNEKYTLVVTREINEDDEEGDEN